MKKTEGSAKADPFFIILTQFSGPQSYAISTRKYRYIHYCNGARYSTISLRIAASGIAWLLPLVRLIGRKHSGNSCRRQRLSLNGHRVDTPAFHEAKATVGASGTETVGPRRA